VPAKRRRFIANRPLTVERDGAEPLEFAAGDECKNTPSGWPPAWVIDEGWVSEVSAAPSAATAAGQDQEGEEK
jgi:hypothetical protein